MAGTVIADTVQLGNSATATQNLVIITNKDGTFSIARGNAGATTQNILKIDANGNLVPLQPGSVIQTVLKTDAGSTTTSTSMVNSSGAFAIITPRSTSSNIKVKCSFYGYPGSTASSISYMNVRLYENNTTPIGQQLSFGDFSTANNQVGGGFVLEAIVANTALTARNFSLWIQCSVAATGGGAAVNQVWELTEIAA